jgi:hypothetical protein
VAAVPSGLSLTTREKIKKKISRCFRNLNYTHHRYVQCADRATSEVRVTPESRRVRKWKLDTRKQACSPWIRICPTIRLVLLKKTTGYSTENQTVLWNAS